MPLTPTAKTQGHQRRSKELYFGIDGDKAPGPDGFTALFFKASWLIVGGDVTEAILYFFQHNKLLPAFNSSIVALVPKC